MRYSKYLLASALICFCAHHAVLAQGQEMPRRNCRECVVTRIYNPVKKTTVVLLKLMTVADVPGGKMYFSLSTTYGTKESSFKKVISVSVTIIAKDLFEAKDPELRAQVDDNAIKFGRLALSHTESVEDLKISLYSGHATWEDVLKLGQGKKVDLSFDEIKFRLTQEHKNAILDFFVYAEGDDR